MTLVLIHRFDILHEFCSKFLDFLARHSHRFFPCLEVFLRLHQLLDLGLDALGLPVDPILFRLHLLCSFLHLEVPG